MMMQKKRGGGFLQIDSVATVGQWRHLQSQYQKMARIQPQQRQQQQRPLQCSSSTSERGIFGEWCTFAVATKCTKYGNIHAQSYLPNVRTYGKKYDANIVFFLSLSEPNLLYKFLSVFWGGRTLKSKPVCLRPFLRLKQINCIRQRRTS